MGSVQRRDYALVEGKAGRKQLVYWTIPYPIIYRWALLKPKTENNGKIGLPIPFISRMGRGTQNFALRLVGFASRLGLSRCEDGNNGTEKKNNKKTGKNRLENERSVGTGGSWGMRYKMGKMGEMPCDFTKHTFRVGLRAKGIDSGRTPCHI